MATRYTMINGKEYVSLRRYWNMQGKYETLKAKCDELEKENEKLKEQLKYVDLERDRQTIFLMTGKRY